MRLHFDRPKQPQDAQSSGVCMSWFHMSCGQSWYGVKFGHLIVSSLSPAKSGGFCVQIMQIILNGAHFCTESEKSSRCHAFVWIASGRTMFLKAWNLFCLEECLVFGRRQIEKILAIFVLVCAGVQALLNKMIHAAAVWWCNLVLYAFRIQVAGWCNRGVVGVPTELVSVTILHNHVVHLKGARIVCTPCVSQSNFSWTFWSGAIFTNRLVPLRRNITLEYTLQHGDQAQLPERWKMIWQTCAFSCFILLLHVLELCWSARWPLCLGMAGPNMQFNRICVPVSAISIQTCLSSNEWMRLFSSSSEPTDQERHIVIGWHETPVPTSGAARQCCRGAVRYII